MTGKEFFFCQCFFFKREKLFVFLFQFIQSSIFFFLASLSVLLVYWLALRSGLILFFLNVKKIFKSIENVLIPLSLVVVPDPSALGLAAIPGRPKRLGSNGHAINFFYKIFFIFYKKNLNYP